MKFTKYRLKEIIREEIQNLTEAKSEKVYMLNGMLWLSYSPNSGQTTRIRGRGWITDKSSEKNFDSGVKGFAKWSQYQKPIKKKTASNGSKVSLFKIPEYSGGDAKEYDIWGGDEKPKKWAYLLVSIGKKINVISVFRSKAEAMSWLGYTSEGKLNEGADWILLKSINKMIDSYSGFFLDKDDPMFGEPVEAGNKEWKKLYKKASSKDRKTIDYIVKQLRY